MGKYFASVSHLKAASMLQEKKKKFYKPQKGRVSLSLASLFFSPSLCGGTFRSPEEVSSKQAFEIELEAIGWCQCPVPCLFAGGVEGIVLRDDLGRCRGAFLLFWCHLLVRAHRKVCGSGEWEWNTDGRCGVAGVGWPVWGSRCPPRSGSCAPSLQGTQMQLVLHSPLSPSLLSPQLIVKKTKIWSLVCSVRALGSSSSGLTRKVR